MEIRARRQAGHSSCSLTELGMRLGHWIWRTEETGISEVILPVSLDQWPVGSQGMPDRVWVSDKVINWGRKFGWEELRDLLD